MDCSGKRFRALTVTWYSESGNPIGSYTPSMPNGVMLFPVRVERVCTNLSATTILADRFQTKTTDARLNCFQAVSVLSAFGQKGGHSAFEQTNQSILLTILPSETIFHCVKTGALMYFRRPYRDRITT